MQIHAPHEAAALGQPTLLFVDDEPEQLALVRAVFQQDHIVWTAAGADEALGVLEREPVDVLLADERMPGTPGIELLRQVAERFPDVSRVIVSACARRREAPRGDQPRS